MPFFFINSLFIKTVVILLLILSEDRPNMTEHDNRLNHFYYCPMAWHSQFVRHEIHVFGID